MNSRPVDFFFYWHYALLLILFYPFFCQDTPLSVTLSSKLLKFASSYNLASSFVFLTGGCEYKSRSPDTLQQASDMQA